MIGESITKTEFKGLFIKINIGFFWGLLILFSFLMVGFGLHAKDVFGM